MIATQSPMPSFHTKASVVMRPERNPSMTSAVVIVRESVSLRLTFQTSASGASAVSGANGSRAGGASDSPVLGASGGGFCPSTTIGVWHALQRILTFLPLTLSSAIVYCALHAWQVTFIAGGTLATLLRISPQLWAFSPGLVGRGAPPARAPLTLVGA